VSASRGGERRPAEPDRQPDLWDAELQADQLLVIYDGT